MKKLILLFCLTLASVSFSDQGDKKAEVFFGGDVAPKFKHTVFEETYSNDPYYYTNVGSKTDEKGFGFELGGEYRYEIIDGLELGAGLSYQRHPKFKQEEKINWKHVGGTATWDPEEIRIHTYEGRIYDSVPLYLTAKYNFKVNAPVTPFLKADLGYSFNVKGDLDYTVDRTDDWDSSHPNGVGSRKTETKSVDYKIKNGIYYGIGAGVTYNQFNASVNYKVNTAKLKVGSDSRKVDYSRVTLQIGYNFGL